MEIIRLPKTPKSAFNPDRPASALLLDQLAHLEWAVRPASQRKPNQLPKIKAMTERQVSARIAELTRRLHPQGAPAPAEALPVAPRPRKKGAQKKSKAAHRRRVR